MFQLKAENKLPPELVFYCKDCHKIVETIPVGRKFVYRCKICGTKNVAFGTLKSIKNFYRVSEEEQSAAPVGASTVGTATVSASTVGAAPVGKTAASTVTVAAPNVSAINVEAKQAVKPDQPKG